jgi:hypothetical protein
MWHRSDIADRRDGPMNSMAILRRDLVSFALLHCNATRSAG